MNFTELNSTNFTNEFEVKQWNMQFKCISFFPFTNYNLYFRYIPVCLLVCFYLVKYKNNYSVCIVKSVLTMLEIGLVTKKYLLKCLIDSFIKLIAFHNKYDVKMFGNTKKVSTCFNIKTTLNLYTQIIWNIHIHAQAHNFLRKVYHQQDEKTEMNERG